MTFIEVIIGLLVVAVLFFILLFANDLADMNIDKRDFEDD